MSLLARMVLALALLALTAPRALAERALSLDEALHLARTYNRDLRAARARLEQSATDIERAWVALLPRVSAQGKYTHNYKEVALDLGQTLNGGVLGLADTLKTSAGDPAQVAAIGRFEQSLSAASSQPIVIQKGEQLDATLNASMPLLVPSAYLDLRAAKLSHHASQANFEVTEANVLLGVAQAYFAAAGADELVHARQNAVAVAQQTLSRAQVRLEAGSATPVDSMRAEVALVAAEQALIEARDVREQAYLALATLVGTHEVFRVAPAARLPGEPASEAALIKSALQLRPELAFYGQSIGAAKASSQAARWRWAPSLSAFGTLQGFNYQGFSGDKYLWAAGLQLDFPLYDGGLRTAQRRWAQAQQREYEARLDLLRDTVSDEVANARRALATKRRGLEASTRSAELSREALRLVRVQYDTGRATQLDLLQAQDSLVGAEVAQAQARFALALADLQLQRSAGTFPEPPSRRDSPARR